MAAGAHGVVYRNVTSPALVDCVRKIARGESWVQDMAVPSELTENDMVGLRVRDRLTAKELRIVASSSRATRTRKSPPSWVRPNR